MMNIINDTLEQRGLLLKGGTMVDATIIHAPPSTKNQERKRDPEMHQTKKGNQWYFGMKVHVGADVNSGLVHTVSVTPANVSDIRNWSTLKRGGAEQPVPVGLPFYHFPPGIAIQHIGALIPPAQAHAGAKTGTRRHPPHARSTGQKVSASNTSAYHNHWVIATREHLDRYHQSVFRAQPIATLAGAAPDFDASAGTSGLKLNDALTHFDRETGYPMAWYFHMLTSKAVPHWVAQTVVEDSLAGFAYLPQRDVDVVRSWLHRPYSV
jgi:hypothetical protein